MVCVKELIYVNFPDSGLIRMCVCGGGHMKGMYFHLVYLYQNMG